MDGYIWLKKYDTNPITDDFIELFGGHFMINPDGNDLFYEDKKHNAYALEEEETKFWDKLCQSVKENKNLFLDNEKY